MLAHIEMPIAIDHFMLTPAAIFSLYFEKPPLIPVQMVAAEKIRTNTLSDIQFALDSGFSSSSLDMLGSFSDTDAFKSEQAKRTAAISISTKAWQHFLLDPNASVDVDAISDTVDAIYDGISDFGPGAIDLRNLSADQVNGEHLAAILRATSSWSASVPGWKISLKIAADALLMAGVEPQDALVGLI